LIVWVRPGVELVRASFRPSSLFSRLDFPTFERPAKATSGNPSSTNPSLPAADLMNSDFSIFSADSGAHREFAAVREPPLAGTRRTSPVDQRLQEPFRRPRRILLTPKIEKTRQ
jgi:hypothetical protein